MTKVPKFEPFHEVKIVPKLEKSTNCDNNLLSSEDAQDATLACICQAISFKGSPGNAWKPQIWPIKLTKAPKLDKSTDHDPNLISSEGGQDKSACKFAGHSLHVFFEKWYGNPKFDPFH